jgi:hypothetical protein
MTIQQSVCTDNSRSGLWKAFFVLCLFTLSGCSGVDTFKNTLRAASRTMVRIATMSLRQEGGPNVVHLEAFEERISNACGSLLDSADYRFRGEDIPVDTKIAVVFTADNCRRVVKQAQPEIEKLQAKGSNDLADAH